MIIKLFFTPLDSYQTKPKYFGDSRSTLRSCYIDNGCTLQEDLKRHPKTLEDRFFYNGETSLLTLPVLSQILCYIDIEGSVQLWKFRTAPFIYTGDLAGLYSAAPNFKSAQDPKEFLLLLSGWLFPTVGEPPRKVLYAVVCLEHNVIIKLEPTIRHFASSEPSISDVIAPSRRMEFADTRNPFQVSIKSGVDRWAHLRLEQGGLAQGELSWIWEQQNSK
jgi:hypothetical protein